MFKITGKRVLSVSYADNDISVKTFDEICRTKPETILIVDDDPKIREILRLLLCRNDFAVTEAAHAEEGLLKMEATIELIILDVMMPGQPGVELCKELRKTAAVPVLFLSAKTRDADKAQGLLCGGDDLINPFSSVELISKIKALLRRYLVYQKHTDLPVSSKICAGGLCVNLDTGEVSVSGQNIVLTSIEYQVLQLLLRNRKRVYSAKEIYEYIWQEPFLPLSNNTIMVHIKNLRKKLGEVSGNPQYIHTAWGRGYYIE